MHRWAVAVDELLAHAIAAAGADDPCRGPLTSAAEDTADLLDLLRTADADLGLNDRATLHAICNLWETSLEHVEPVAAAVDPGWHRRWQARAVVARRLRHGQIDAPARPLPYRT
jgi:hypothetical protein